MRKTLFPVINQLFVLKELIAKIVKTIVLPNIKYAPVHT